MHNSGDDNTNATIQQEASLALSVCEDTRRITEDERLDTDDSCTRYDNKDGPSAQIGPRGLPPDGRRAFWEETGPRGPPPDGRRAFVSKTVDFRMALFLLEK